MHLVEPGRDEAVVPSLIQYEARVDDSLPALDPGDDLLRARHLGHAGRIDEAHRLDARDAGGGEQVDQLRTRRRIEDGLLVLEPVARPDIADRDRRHRTPCSFSAPSSSSERPSRPP